ncbi:hypothetical protein D3C81_771100 [compost metagenome]
MQNLFLEVDRLMQVVDQAGAKAVDFVAAVHAVHYQDKLVTAQAGHQITVAGRFTQAGGDFQQHRVAGGMAEGVVDRFETVQVQQQQRQRSRVLAFEQGLFEKT